MKGFITGILATILVWSCGWERVASVLDSADVAAKQAVSSIETHVSHARAARARATQPRGRQ
jgi:hypothetical protein